MDKVKDFLYSLTNTADEAITYSKLFRLLSQRENLREAFEIHMIAGDEGNMEYVMDEVELINNDIIKLLKL